MVLHCKNINILWLNTGIIISHKCCENNISTVLPGRIVQSVGRLTHDPEVLGLIPSLATYFISPSADSRRAVVSYWRKYVHEKLVNRKTG